MTESAEAWPAIPMPSVLQDGARSFGNRDPETSGDAGPIYSAADKESNAPQAEEQISEYARQLWNELKTVVQYLRDEVARGGRGDGSADPAPKLSTDEQWHAWIATVAPALSTLAGPAGDEGYGEQEARLEYQNNFVYRTQ